MGARFCKWGRVTQAQRINALRVRDVICDVWGVVSMSQTK
eukprot:COSAG05_NODE_19_length_34900_cov_72.237464_28_plen_40_part_00